MPKPQTDYLIQLIRSMSKSEKRFFKVFVRRNNAHEDVMFIQLFDVIDRMKYYDEEVILNKVHGVKKAQLSNLKAHLYKQLLLSLRLLHRQTTIDIDLHERLDYARILYDKGLYRQSLEILDKIKGKAQEANLYTLALEVVEFEKLIESQYITRSIDSRADTLSEEALLLARKVEGVNAYSNLSLRLYSLYLKVGYARNEKDYQYIRQYFQSSLPKYKVDELGFYGKLYYYQAHNWYYYLTQEFIYYYKYSQKWVDLFHDQPLLQDLEQALYIKGLHNLLNAHFLTGQYARLEQSLNELESLLITRTLDKNTEGLLVLFTYVHKINKHYLEGTFSEGIKLVKPLTKLIEENPYNWDEHRIMVFWYKVACLYFGSGDYGTCITYLNKIINQINPNFREDIQGFSRILSLIAHFELGNRQLVDYQVKSVFRFLSKMEDVNKVQYEVLRFLRQLPRIYLSDLKQEFLRLKEKLLKLENDPYERRPFLYLDIISWLESKIANKPVQTIIREKFLKRKQLAEAG